METDVAAFARQLRQDGIEAARAEADKIVAEARARAERIAREARAAADKTLQEGVAEIDRLRRRQTDELRLAARDAMLQVRQDIERLVMRLLQARIAPAIATEEVVRAAVLEFVAHLPSGSEWEIGVGPAIGRPLLQAVVDDLLKGREALVALTEEFRGSGLVFRPAGGGEVLELSEESVAEAFRQLLSPELAKLIENLSK